MWPSSTSPAISSTAESTLALASSPRRDPQTPSFFGLARKRPDLAALSLAAYLQTDRGGKARDGRLWSQASAILRGRRRQLGAILEKRLSKAGRSGAADLEQRALQRLSFGWNLVDQNQIETLGVRAYVDRQLRPEMLDDGGLEEALLETLPALSMSPAQRMVTYYEREEELFLELLLAHFYRRLYSPRQLFERLVSLWSDHFNTFLFSDFGPWLKPTDDFEVIRHHALGRFPELLRASARSPAMLDYLTNDSNVKGHANENYARELMELHSLGVDGGYSERDVKEVARCLTGWTFHRGEEAGEQWGRFHFDAAAHDDGEKTVLGQVIAAGGGIGDGERVLSLLAGHASTARFVARKMLRHFWGYEPDEHRVDTVAEVYEATDGDIPSMVETCFRWWNLSRAEPKVKRPQMLFSSALRAVFADVSDPLPVIAMLLAAGHLPFNWGPPNGYPDSAGYWSGYLMPRFDFASLFLTASGEAIALDFPGLDPNADPLELVNLLDQLLTGGTLGLTERSAIESFLRRRPPSLRTFKEAVGLVVSSPSFQSY